MLPFCPSKILAFEFFSAEAGKVMYVTGDRTVVGQQIKILKAVYQEREES